MFKRAVFFAVILFFKVGGVYAATVDLPQTGQTTCYDAGGKAIDCAGTGQDAEIKGGAPWPNPRFTAGTGAEADCITDNQTGLMWPKDGNLAAATKRWADALTYADTLSLCGHSDWRLPNRKELRSLVNLGQSNNDTWLNTQEFTNVQAYWYWSATTYAPSSSYAWAVNMGNGSVTHGDKAGNALYVWPVRAGQ